MRKEKGLLRVAFDVIADFCVIAVNPLLWVQNCQYSQILDDEINSLDWNKVKVVDDCYVEVDGLVLWVGNHPYASFEIDELMPSRRTRVRLMKVISPHIKKYKENKIKKAIAESRVK